MRSFRELRRFCLSIPVLVIWAIAAMAGCSDETDIVAPADPRQFSLLPAPNAIEGEFIVLLKHDVERVPDVAAELAGQAGGQLVRSYDRSMKWLLLRSTDAKRLERLKNDPRIQAIGPNLLVSLDITDDLSALSGYGRWGLDQLDQRTLVDQFFGVPSWSYYQNTSSVHIYMIDSGIDGAHTDFSGRLGSGWGWSGVTPSGYVNLNPYAPCGGHGTLATGVAAGTRTGTARDAIIHSVRVDLTTSDSTCGGTIPTNRLIEGMNWVRNNRILPAVANINTSPECAGVEGTCAAIDAAVQDLMNAGVTVTASAGNENINACGQSPQRVAGVIVVGNMTVVGAKDGYSNFGPCVTLFAPGKDVVTTVLGGGLGNREGTSISAPMTAGVAALIRAAGHSNVKDILTWSATPGVLTGIGSGSPNRLLYSLHTTLNVVGPSWISASDDYTWTASATGGASTRTFDWYKSWNGSSWFWVGSGNAFTSYVDQGDPSFHIRVVMQTGGETLTYDQWVLVSGM